jgi:hypothetical protein
MKATLNLRKEDLRAKLVERVEEIKAYFDGKRDEIQEVIDERAAATDDKTMHAEFYETLAAGLRDGSITLSTTGKLRGAPPKPGTKAAGGRRSRGDWNYYSTEQLESRKGQYDAAEKDEIKPVQTAIDLLDLATDETVEIDTTDYHNLLNGNRHRHW